MSKIPTTPAGLGPRGRKYWRKVNADYELTGSEVELLVEICRTLDRLDLLDAAVRELGATTFGSAGQTVVNPALTEARGQQALLHRLVAALRLPDEDGATVPTGHQLRGAAANAARWSGHAKDA